MVSSKIWKKTELHNSSFCDFLKSIYPLISAYGNAYGNSTEVHGKDRSKKHDTHQDDKALVGTTCIASWHDRNCHGKPTRSGVFHFAENCQFHSQSVYQNQDKES